MASRAQIARLALRIDKLVDRAKASGPKTGTRGANASEPWTHWKLPGESVRRMASRPLLFLRRHDLHDEAAWFFGRAKWTRHLVLHRRNASQVGNYGSCVLRR